VNKMAARREVLEKEQWFRIGNDFIVPPKN